MVTQILWWSGIALAACLLSRAIVGRFFGRYLIFYIYLSHVFLLSLARFLVYLLRRHSYSHFYWYTEFIAVAVGYCVIWWIYGMALAAYPGTVRMASVLIW